MTKERFSTPLHGLRGIAALGVFVGHVTSGYTGHLCAACATVWSERINALGTFGVEVFFLLSGYVIYLSATRAEPRDFLVKRFWRIYPVFLLFTLLFFVANALVQLEPERTGVGYLLLNLSFLNLLAGTPALTPNAWTVTYEVYFYALTFGVLYPWRGDRHRWVSAVFVVLSLLMLWRHPISLHYLAGVLLGVASRHGRGLPLPEAAILRRAIEIGALSVVVWLAATPRQYAWSSLAESPGTLVLLLALTVWVRSLDHPDSLGARVLARRWALVLGTVSYSLYLAHPYSYRIARELTSALLGGPDHSWGQLALFVVLVSAATALLVGCVHRFVEAPLYRFGTGQAIVGTRASEESTTAPRSASSDSSAYRT